MKIEYPADFIRRVKEFYPDVPKLHEHLDNNNELVGRYLNDSSQGGMGAEWVLELINAGKVDELREEAVRLKTAADLYSEWSQLYQKAKAA